MSPRRRRLALGWVSLVAIGCWVAPVARAEDHKKPRKHSAAAASRKAPAHEEAAPQPPASEPKHAAESAQPAETMQTRGPTRLDFDDRMVQGQGSKVGAVYLYDRKNLPLRSMVRKRENFRDQIGSDEVAGPVVE